jgi:hypothetical protein
METYSIITFVGGFLAGAGIMAALIGGFLFWLFSQSE